MKADKRTVEELREQVEATRLELGSTVEELAAKTAIKARVHHRVDHVKEGVAHTRHQIAGRGRQIASDVPYAVSDAATDGLYQAKLSVKRRPIRAAAIGGSAIAVLIGLTRLRHPV